MDKLERSTNFRKNDGITDPRLDSDEYWRDGLSIYKKAKMKGRMEGMDELNKHEIAILNYIMDCFKLHMEYPNYRVIEKELNLSSYRQVRNHMKSLEDKGFISIKSRRGYTLTEKWIIKALQRKELQR